MELGKDALGTALRVLMAVGDKEEPDPTDIEALRRFAPLRAAAPADELACHVIQQELKRREALRKAVGS